MKKAPLMILACMTLWASVPSAAAPEARELRKVVIIDDATAAKLTNDTEQLLHETRLPKVDFKQAAIADIIYFFNISIQDRGKTPESKRIRITLDPGADRDLMTFHTWEGGGGIKGVYTFGGLDMSVLEAVQVLQELAHLERTVNGAEIVLSKKKESHEVRPAGGADGAPAAGNPSAHP